MPFSFDFRGRGLSPESKYRKLFKMLERTGYAPVTDGAVSPEMETLTEDGYDTTSVGSFEYDEKRKLSVGHQNCLLWYSNGVTLLLCLILFLYINTHSQSASQNCVRKLSAYCESYIEPASLPLTGIIAPLLEAIDEQDFHDVRFKYSLWYQSPYKGPPTPEVNDAWHELMQCKPHNPWPQIQAHPGLPRWPNPCHGL